MSTQAIHCGPISWQPFSCSDKNHLLITVIVTSVLAILAITLHVFGIGGKIAPALFGAAAGLSVVISFIIATCKKNNPPPLETTFSQEAAVTRREVQKKPTTDEAETTETFDESTFLEPTPPITPQQPVTPLQPQPSPPQLQNLPHARGVVISPTPQYPHTKDSILTIYRSSKTFGALNTRLNGLQALPLHLKMALLVEICCAPNNFKQALESQVLDCLLLAMTAETLNAPVNDETLPHLALKNSVVTARKLIAHPLINPLLVNGKKESLLQAAMHTNDEALVESLLKKIEAHPDGKAFLKKNSHEVISELLKTNLQGFQPILAILERHGVQLGLT